MTGEQKVVTLGDIADITKLAGFEFTKHVKYDPKGEIIALRALNLKDGVLNLESVQRISKASSDGLPRSKLYKDDILFSYTGTIGEVALVDQDDKYHLAPNICRLRVKAPTKPRYVYYYLRSPVFRDLLSGYVVGSTQPTVPMKNIRRIEIPVPSEEEQKAIVRILSSLDEKIELNRRMNETLEAMARALFKSWCVDFDPVRAKAERRALGLPKSLADLFPDSFEDSELGEIPKGWSVKVMSDILTELETGGRPKGGVSSYTSGTPSIGAESIVGLGIFDFSKTKYVPEEFFEKMTKGQIKNRDVLLYKDGGRPGEFEPHVTLFGDGFPFDTCAINEHVYRMQAKQELGQNYLFFWLSSDLVMEEMRIKGTGVAIPGLNSTQVKSLTTLVPAIDVAKAFDAFVDPYIAKVLANCNESRTLATLRDTLLPMLISGEVRVTDAQKYSTSPPSPAHKPSVSATR